MNKRTISLLLLLCLLVSLCPAGAFADDAPVIISEPWEAILTGDIGGVDPSGGQTPGGGGSGSESDDEDDPWETDIIDDDDDDDDEAEKKQRAENAVLVVPKNVLTVGEKMQLSLSGDLTGLSVSWSGSDAGIFTVSGSGLVTAVAAGKANVTADVHGIKKTAELEVKDATVTTYTVTYNANGGQNAPEPQQKLKGTPLTLTNSIPSRAGFGFGGWAESKTASSAKYQPGSSYTEDRDITLYAVWKVAPKTTKITVTPSAVNLYGAGQQVQLSVSALPEGASTAVTWKSSSSAVATVDANGLVTAGNKLGSATITATAADGSKKTAKCTVKVVQPVTGLDVTAPAGQEAVVAGKSIQLKAVLSPAKPGVKTVEWAFEPQVNGITLKNGKLTVGKDVSYTGPVTVTATAVGCPEPISVPVTVNVAAPVTSITMYADGEPVNPKVKGELWVGAKETVQLSTVISPAAAWQNVTWKSSSAKVATVDENGLVTAHGKGSVTITATSCDGLKKVAKYSIAVGVLPSDIKITAKPYMAMGTSLTPKAVVEPKDVSNKKLEWSIIPAADGNIVKFDEKTGKISVSKSWTGKPETVTVTATSVADPNVTVSFRVNIVEALAKSVKIYNEYLKAVSSVKMAVGSSDEFTAVVTGSDLTNIIWESSNPTVASVDDGTVTAHSMGKATITATSQDGNKTAKLTVTVK